MAYSNTFVVPENHWSRNIRVSVACTILNVGVLAIAATTLSAITAFDDDASEEVNGYNYEGSSRYRGAAGWILAVACAAILLHIFGITVRFLQRMSLVNIKMPHVVIICIVDILFALSFIAGALVNFIYALENVSLIGDICSGDNDYDSDPDVTDDTCQHLEVVIGTEFALAVLSFILFMFYVMVLPKTMWQSYMCDKQQASAVRNNGINSQPQQAEPPSHVPPEVPHPTSSPNLYVTPSAPQLVSSYVTPGAPQLVTSHVMPTGLSHPPTNASVQVPTSPPPYELALAMARGPKYASSIGTKPDITG